MDKQTFKAVKMPPGSNIPNPTKKKVRPSSAAAKIQSHPTYSTGLYDNSRPSTAAASLSRPKTQAGGPRHYVRTPQSRGEEEVARPTQRRLTIGPTDGIADSEDAHRTIVGQPQLGALFKGKVRICENVICL